MTTPMLDKLKDAATGTLPLVLNVTEVRALLAEIGTRTPTPPRRLREYKGVTYRDGKWWFRELSYDKAARLIAIVCGFTDTDHAALMDLAREPYEPVVSERRAVVDLCKHCYMQGRTDREAFQKDWHVYEKVVPQVATPTPPRRLREYRVTEDFVMRYEGNAWQYKTAPTDPAWYEAETMWDALTECVGEITDDTVRALLALRDDPWEAAPTLESIIEPALTAMYELGWDRHGGSTDMAAEDLAKDIRRAFPSLDAPPKGIDPETGGYWFVAPRALTAGEHIAALRAGGALIQDTIAAYHTNPDRPPRVLVLTPEQWGTP